MIQSYETTRTANIAEPLRLSIKASERWIIIGKTGSGKTEFCKYLLRLVAQKVPVVIVDPKEMWTGAYPHWESNHFAPGTIDKPHLVQGFNARFRVQCLQPDEESSGDERLHDMCYDMLKRGNRFLYIDETEGIATANSVPSGLRRIWKTGRAKGIGAWVATQTPTCIPKIFKSQAEHFVAFKVGQEDVELVANIVHVARAEIASLKNYEWIYYNTDMDRGVKQAPIPYKKVK